MPNLHHFAVNIAPGTIDTAINLFEQLGFHVGYREAAATWCMLSQKGNPVDIQIIEVDHGFVPHPQKISTHVGFLSDDPAADLSMVADWANEHGLQLKTGKWQDTMLWFDLPEVFVNFVVEVMHTSVVR